MLKKINIFALLFIVLAVCALLFLAGANSEKKEDVIDKIDDTLQEPQETSDESVLNNVEASTPEAAPKVEAKKGEEKVVIIKKKPQKAVVSEPKPATVTTRVAKKTPERTVFPKSIRDPFRVDFSVKKLTGQEAEDEEEVEKEFMLRGVIVGAGREVALIDDMVVEVGDYIYGWKVVGIKKDRIGLKSGKLIKKLYLKEGGLISDE